MNEKKNFKRRPEKKTLLEEKVLSITRVTKVGRGIVAGGAARAVLELAGVKDVMAKSLGSSVKINVAKATLEALLSQQTKEQVAKLRGKEVEEI